VLGAYERVLGLARCQLVVAASGLVNGGQPDSARPHPLETEAVLAHAQLDELFEVVFAGDARGHVWMDLCEMLTRQRHLYLLPDTWAQVSDLLADELGRSAGLAYLSRFEALRMLMRHPTSLRHAVRALGSIVTNAATEFVVHPLSLLQEVDDRQASDVLLRLLSEAPGQLRTGAAWAIAGKLSRNHFDAEEIGRLESAALAMLHGSRGPVHRIDVLGIHASLPRESQDRLTRTGLDVDDRAALELSQRQAELARPEEARSVSAKLAERVQNETPSAQSVEPDLMLRRLIREALFHVNHERRHQATLLLSASPYRTRLADHLMMLVAHSDEGAAVVALTALFQIADDRQRGSLLHLGLTEQRTRVRVAALMALGQVVGRLSGAEADDLCAGLPPEGPVGRATAYALGMGGAGARLGEGDTSPERVASAEWWQRRGAIVEVNA
jgi:hypothetical protein